MALAADGAEEGPPNPFDADGRGMAAELVCFLALGVCVGATFGWLVGRAGDEDVGSIGGLFSPRGSGVCGASEAGGGDTGAGRIAAGGECAALGTGFRLGSCLVGGVGVAVGDGGATVRVVGGVAGTVGEGDAAGVELLGAGLEAVELAGALAVAAVLDGAVLDGVVLLDGAVLLDGVVVLDGVAVGAGDEAELLAEGALAVDGAVVGAAVVGVADTEALAAVGDGVGLAVADVGALGVGLVVDGLGDVALLVGVGPEPARMAATAGVLRSTAVCWAKSWL